MKRPAIVIRWPATLAAALGVSLAPAPTAAATVADTGPDLLAPIVVTATLTAQPAFDVPASVTTIDLGHADVAARNINASEYLRQVPGVLARNRQNYAQDEQISIRGFGARSTFGVRGVRLYTDGIPATMPDGQGQVSNFDLDAAGRIEVLRGPFSALYGNSSGGVIQIFTADGSVPPEQLGSFGAGSHGTWRLDAGARGTRGGFGYNLDLSQFQTAGYRAHSRATRTLGNAKLTFATGSGGKLTLVANTIAMPLALDPQGLTADQYRADPRAAAPSALAFNTRKSAHQAQAGAIFEQPLGHGQTLRLLAYGGHRGVTQFLSVPVAAQRNPLSSGGVVDNDTFYGGTDLRWAARGTLAGRPWDIAAGVAYDNMRQHRLGYENFVGDRLGVIGALRRDEQDDVANVDEYVQAGWKFAPRWSLTLGARHSDVRFHSRDAYITAANPDDSGRVGYGSTNPVAGLMFDVTGAWHVYASYGRGFATPTFSELAYRPAGSGLNFALAPSHSRHAELGSKWRGGRGASIDVALFDIHTGNEIGVLSSAGGRTVYRNVGATRRRGIEVAGALPLGERWTFHTAYTWLDARFLDVTDACGTDCSGRPRLPGVPRQQVHADLAFAGSQGWHAAINVDAEGAVRADDAGTRVAPGHALLGLSAGRTWVTARARVTPFARIDNLLDQRSIGSVIVDQASGGSFEPAPGRSWFVGVRVAWLDPPAA